MLKSIPRIQNLFLIFELPDLFYESSLHLKRTTDLDFLSDVLGKFTQKLCISLALNVYCFLNGMPATVRGRELLHPRMPTKPWGTNPFLTDVIKHVSYEFPGGHDFWIHRNMALCTSFQSILEQQSPLSFYFEVNHLFEGKNYSLGDLIFVGDENSLRFTCVISHFDSGVPCAEFAMKNTPFECESTTVKLQQNNRKKIEPGPDTLHVYRRKMTMQLVSEIFLNIQ